MRSNSPLGPLPPDNTPYDAASWDGSFNDPTKDAIRDKIETMLAGGIDHGTLAGLADDDHAQYHNNARGDARYYTEAELNAGQLDNRYYTETELNNGQLDNRYFRENEHINVSAGAVDAGKPIILDAAGHVDATMLNDGDIDHGLLAGLGDDDHVQYLNTTRHSAISGNPHGVTYTETGAEQAGVAATLVGNHEAAADPHAQYHNDARGDARYYTETELDAGQLDNRYFRENEHINSSAGAADAGKPIALDAAGHIDATMLNDADIDHGSISGLADDDHTQYALITGARAIAAVPVSSQSDNYAVQLTDFGKSLRMNNAASKTFTLPAVGAPEDGSRITFVKVGAGRIIVAAGAGDFIDDSAAGGTIYSDTSYATLTLEYVHALTMWVILSGNGTWITT